MTDAQNIFYTSISTYYSEIFPFNPMQLKFVKNKLGELYGKSILDIGCATGELAFQLVTGGAEVTGIDLNEDLLQQAISNKKHEKLTFQQGNMLELTTDFKAQQFEAVLCFGNTLVHLNSEALVLQMLVGAETVLKPGGKLLIQLLNYDYICGQRVEALPLIETENIRFIRRYNFSDDSELIGFQTDLEIKAENHTVSNETSLLALKSETLKALLEKAGFRNIEFYANFKQDAFGGKHLPLVVSCEK
ncbi:methyltransferase domain-containing protein [Draconibacterium sp. IB214405]|uniref:class I SAM-dependent methyltransferase n=1 Tax=Draconibacterium sp. IB214405 TaxID=3097352 RepID=UPI002A17932F|nr:methyltransferase domain-containing protein [Draconibacterium sp. IB214405]MDX8340039.1 methyltransferase domain-containing protein [Draconibacterium sp. IB214405]